MKSKIYIDFDGVILDTWEVIFKKYYEKFNIRNGRICQRT